MGKDPEFFEKLVARTILFEPLIEDYEPEDKFLKTLKDYFTVFIMAEHPKHGKLKTAYENVRNFVIKLADNDPAYRSRLIAFIIGLQRMPFKFTADEILWAKAHFQRLGIDL